jgi:hypothetical protein
MFEGHQDLVRMLAGRRGCVGKGIEGRENLGLCRVEISGRSFKPNTLGSHLNHSVLNILLSTVHARKHYFFPRLERLRRPYSGNLSFLQSLALTHSMTESQQDPGLEWISLGEVENIDDILAAAAEFSTVAKFEKDEKGLEYCTAEEVSRTAAPIFATFGSQNKVLHLRLFFP